MKDALGNSVIVGDTVIFMQTNYRKFIKARVKRITNKCVFLSHGPTNMCSTETKQFHDQIVRYTEKV